MRTRDVIVLLLVAATGLLLSSLAAQAGKMPTEPITIDGLYPVKFDHVLHRTLEVPCGECHHNEEHKPRSPEEIFAIPNGNELHCRFCHNKNFATTYLQSREEIFHVNCRVCHAVGINGNRGPRKCTGCHKDAVSLGAGHAN